MRLSWSREDIARYSGASVAFVYLVERLGSSTEGDDARIRDALAKGLATREAKIAGRESSLSTADAKTDLPAKTQAGLSVEIAEKPTRHHTEDWAEINNLR